MQARGEGEEGRNLLKYISQKAQSCLCISSAVWPPTTVCQGMSRHARMEATEVEWQGPVQKPRADTGKPQKK